MLRALVSSALLLASAAGAQVTIEVGSLTTEAGGSGSVEVKVRTARNDVGGTGNGISWDGPFSFDDCVANADIQREVTAFAFMPSGCRDASDCISMRAVVLSFGLGAPPPPLDDGAVLYTCEVAVLGNAAAGDYPLSCNGPEASTGIGLPIVADCLDGVVTVREPTPTATPSATPSPPPPTETATVAPSTATATATSPPVVPVCPGDCDGDFVVSIDELVAAVRIALDEALVASCPAANPDRDSMVEIAELVRAVRAALDGCTLESLGSRVGITSIGPDR